MNWQQAALDVTIFWMLTTPHEFAHAWVAERLGDDTPRLEGRVTLNPLAHVDWIGTVILPALTVLFGGGFLGWGRPVNTNIAKLRGGHNGLLAVALAGPFSNVLFALLLALLAAVMPNMTELAIRAAYLSLYLAVFNMLPVPPLDGSKILLALRIPAAVYNEIGRFGFLLILIAMTATDLGLWMSNFAFNSAVGFLRLFQF